MKLMHSLTGVIARDGVSVHAEAPFEESKSTARRDSACDIQAEVSGGAATEDLFVRYSAADGQEGRDGDCPG